MTLFIRRFVSLLALIALSFSLSACGKSETVATNSDAIPSDIKIGVVPGPYREILEKYLDPLLKKAGHNLVIVEFSDWVQPDSALAAGDIDANVFQHQSYLNGIVKDQNLKLESVVNIPTLGIFVVSDKFSSLDQIQSNSQVAIPNDPVNLARSLRVARDIGLITLDSNKDEKDVSIADIKQNKKHLNFIPIEAAQLPRCLDSIDIAFVPGNYAYAAKLDLTKALAKENVQEPIKLVVAVQSSKVQSVGALLKKLVQDPEFVKGVDSDPVFKNFSKPAWWSTLAK